LFGRHGFDAHTWNLRYHQKGSGLDAAVASEDHVWLSIRIGLVKPKIRMLSAICRICLRE
jgi:hypothetical protein